MTATPLKLPPSPSKELLSSTSFLLKRLGWVIKERGWQAYEGTGLSPQHYGVLSMLDEAPREAQGTIADALGYDRSHLVGLLDELEERGLVARKRDPSDRRRHLVTLTPSGKEKLSELRAISKRLDKEFFAPLDVQQRETLHELLVELAGYHDARFAPAKK